MWVARRRYVKDDKTGLFWWWCSSCICGSTHQSVWCTTHSTQYTVHRAQYSSYLVHKYTAHSKQCDHYCKYTDRTVSTRQTVLSTWHTAVHSSSTVHRVVHNSTPYAVHRTKSTRSTVVQAHEHEHTSHGKKPVPSSYWGREHYLIKKRSAHRRGQRW